MNVSRREVLKIAASLGILPVLPTLAGCGDSASSGAPLPEYEYDGPQGPEDLFALGVASGDPLCDAVILWTRADAGDGLEVDVFWEVARDEGFQERVGAGWILADEDTDFTCKLDAVGLESGTTYYYRFQAMGRVSAVGRTRTLPEGPTERFSIAAASCSRYNGGYFSGYRHIAEQPVDLVVHLGDYIYEYGSQGPVRPHDPPKEIFTLDEYRRRYKQYRSDPDLQEAHRRHPFSAIQDDHESANNCWAGGAPAHDEDLYGPWAERRAAADRAYSEYMPHRPQAGGRMYRALQCGDLLDIVLLDTRSYRDEQIADGADVAGIQDPGRTMLGAEQEAWVGEQFGKSRGRWVVVGNQVIFSPWKVIGAPNASGGGLIANVDGWDGYQQTRSNLFAALRDAGNPDLIVLTGDVHSSWAFEVVEDPNNPDAYDPETGRGSAGVEFVTPGITSTFAFPGLDAVFRNANPHLMWSETVSQGYLVLDLTPDRAEVSWFHLDDVTSPDSGQSLAKQFRVEHGTKHLVEL